MPHLVPSDVHADKYLTNVSIGFKNEEANYIAEQVVPIIPVGNETDRYATYTQADFARREAKIIADGDPSPRGGFATSYGTYSCDEHAIAMALGPRTLSNSDSVFRLETTAAEWVADQLLIEREYQVASTIFNASNFTNTAAIGVQWQLANATPIDDIMAGMDKVEDQATGRSANTIVMGVECWRKFVRNSQVLAFLFGTGYSGPMIVTPTLFENFLSGYVARPVKLHVGRAVYTTTKEGGTASYTKLWGKNCWIAYVPSNPSQFTPAPAYIFRPSYEVRKYYETPTKTTVIEGREIYAVEVVSAACAYYYTACVA
jgi:hypothetical protein